MYTHFQLRLATFADVPALAALIELSVRGLQAHDYSPLQIELALKRVYGVDTQLIADGTYFAAEATRSQLTHGSRQGTAFHPACPELARFSGESRRERNVRKAAVPVNAENSGVLTPEIGRTTTPSVYEPGSSGEGLLLVGCGGWSKRKTLFGGDHWVQREDDLLDPRRDAAKIRAFFVHPDWTRRGIGTAILDACENAARTAGFTRCEMGATLTGVPFYRKKGYGEREHLEVPLTGGASLPIVRMEKNL